jgi:hypothetical protein
MQDKIYSLQDEDGRWGLDELRRRSQTLSEADLGCLGANHPFQQFFKSGWKKGNPDRSDIL